ncbi:hypothetical protein [Streptomyces sp. TLI_185]|uniref:hypothetical protein n=1 Tax=Streptomyces sp. TLI_185 TaxID=2485151 RepID=UPI000F4D56F1|nr:hypothetical protein [Streptomyces sp. TLI_185]RPF38142.1 hypothetical protein EDD92_8263 [Streptomyces sp. TLI_185]
MTNPYMAPIPPAPRPPDIRPLRKRKRVWLGGAGLLFAGALIVSPANDGKQPVEAKVKPATTITATVTATPEPGPTVTETVKAKAKPAPTVTVTRTAAARAASSDSDGGGSSSSQDSVDTCSIKSNSGNCYSAGQFCRNSDHGAVTTTAGGTPIKCTYSSNAWRWKYA